MNSDQVSNYHRWLVGSLTRLVGVAISGVMKACFSRLAGDVVGVRCQTDHLLQIRAVGVLVGVLPDVLPQERERAAASNGERTGLPKSSCHEL